MDISNNINTFLKILIVFTHLYLVIVKCEPLVLHDNTPQGSIITKRILSNLLTRNINYTFSLLKTKGSNYFTLNPESGQLISSRLIDRDFLCIESKLCCTKGVSTQIDSIYHLASLCAHVKYGGSTVQNILPPYCSFNLTISVSSSPGAIPDLYDVPIVVCEVNDHAPVFKVSPTNFKFDEKSEFKSRYQQPTFIVNISEASSVGYRVRLPLAEDLDAQPYNVQRYEIEPVHSHSSRDVSRLGSSMFKLETIGDVNSLTSPMNAGSMYPHLSDKIGVITGLELVLLEKLDREKVDQYNLRILAIDGGSPPRTGTLQLEIHILDVNDHAPVFSKSVYEVNVVEGYLENPNILQLSATDADHGINAIVHYAWPKGSEWAVLNDDLSTGNTVVRTTVEKSQNTKMLALRLPGYWFHLNKETGLLTLRHPLDYEVESKHVFDVLAYNPVSNVSNVNLKGPIYQTHLSATTATAKVVINVINVNDEAPVIIVDYMSGDNKTVKHITENLRSPYFLALITAWDPDFVFDEDLNIRESSDPHDNNAVICRLETHRDAYKLEQVRDHKQTSPTEIRYALSTQISLDREKSALDQIVIVCQDSADQPKTSTATITVVIDDENDCVPELQVSVPSSPGSQSIERVPPWPLVKLQRWIELQEDKQNIVYAPLFQAFLANIPVYTVSVLENQAAGTVIAYIKAVDPDAGDNGRVIFEIPNTISVVNKSDQLTKTSIQVIDNYHTDQVELFNNPHQLKFIQINSKTGDISTRQIIDREEDYTLLENFFLFIKASDRGVKVRHSKFILLNVKILDENDNPPYFLQKKLQFDIRENLPAPAIVGEIHVIDPDMNPNKYGDLRHFSDMINPVESDNVIKINDPYRSILTDYTQQPRLHLRIDPGHGRRDLPFVIYHTKDGRYFLNTTRALDRELEEAFQFKLIATDHDPVQVVDTKSGQKMLNTFGHTATATVLINVLDVNDNHPEIIFPKPLNANSTLHYISYREYAGHEIVSINANDRDAGKSNGKFYFELLPSGTNGDELFMIDRNTGMLRTRRRFTKQDLGEHQIQIVVRDEGDPPLETRLTMRLRIDQSEPHGNYNAKNVHPVQVNEHNYLLNSDYHKNNKLKSSDDAIDNISEFDEINRGYVKTVHEKDNEQLLMKVNHQDRRFFNSDIVLFIVVILIIILVLIMIGLCIYLKRTKSFFKFLSDTCHLLSLSSTESSNHRNTLRNSKHDHINDKLSEKPYLTNLLDTSQQHEPMESTIYRSNGENRFQLMEAFGSSCCSPMPFQSQLLESSFTNNMSTSNNSGCRTNYEQNVNVPLSPMPNRISNNTSLYNPGTAMALNFTNGLNSADILNTQSGGYYHFVRDPGFRVDNPVGIQSYQTPNQNIIHTYNMGKPQPPIDGQMYVANKFPPISNEMQSSRHPWNPDEFGLRSINTNTHLYHHIQTDDRVLLNNRSYSPMHNVIRPGMKYYYPTTNHPKRATTNTRTQPNVYPTIGTWKSDPSLNQSLVDLSMNKSKSPFTHELNKVDFYDRIKPMNPQSQKDRTTKSQPKRSRSNRRNDLFVNDMSTSSNPNHIDQKNKSIDPDHKSLYTLLNDSKNNRVTDVDHALFKTLLIDPVETNQDQKSYTISFSTVQASFV